MLVDTILEQRAKVVIGDAISYDDLLAPFRSRLLNAEVYVMDADAVAMAANVSLSRPSSILAALSWLRLPHDSIWLEFSNEDLSRAMADLGSPNVRPRNTMGRLKRSGFLLRKEVDGISFEYVHDMAVTGSSDVAELASLRGFYDLSGIGSLTSESAVHIRSASPAAAGKVRQSLDLLARDSMEAGANLEIAGRLDFKNHQDMLPGIEALRSAGRNVERLQADWESEIRRLFLMLCLPSLLLINTRNAVSLEPGPSLEKINKKRTRMGRRPLVEHIVVKLHLTAGQKRAARISSGGEKAIRGTLVAGHFKVRKTGIFWWSPHARSGYGAVTRTTIVTR